jgi:threonine dehydratase
MIDESPFPTTADVEAAARRIAPLVWHTPMARSAWLSEATRSDVWLKLEIVQTTGSFKWRGAVNAVALLREHRPDIETVVTASAGNHGVALAWAARQFGIRARVYLPVTAPAAKRMPLVRLGVEIVDAPSYEAAEALARADAEGSRAVYISPYNHPDVIAGAGTVALEMLADRADLDAIVAPLGGGGLLAGSGIVVKASSGAATSRRLLIGAELEASPVFTSALAAGRVVPVIVRTTLADGLAGNMETGSRTFAMVRDLVDRISLVAESSIEMAMRGLVVHEQLIAEGAAATAVGALLQGGLGLSGSRVGVILSGRNVDTDVVRRLLAQET